MLVIWIAGLVFCERVLPGSRTTDLHTSQLARVSKCTQRAARLSERQKLVAASESNGDAGSADAPETEDERRGHSVLLLV